jgi:hypothetical protein
MGDVKAAVGGIIGILGRPGITIDVVTEEIPRICRLSIPSYRKMLGMNGQRYQKKKYG